MHFLAFSIRGQQKGGGGVEGRTSPLTFFSRGFLLDKEPASVSNEKITCQGHIFAKTGQ